MVHFSQFVLLRSMLHFSSQNVVGEIYEIDDDMLEFCDDFEEHPDVYERTHIPIRVLPGMHNETCCKICRRAPIQKMNEAIVTILWTRRYDRRCREKSLGRWQCLSLCSLHVFQTSSGLVEPSARCVFPFHTGAALQGIVRACLVSFLSGENPGIFLGGGEGP